MGTDHPGTVRLRQEQFDDFYRVQWSAIHRPLAVTFNDAELAAEAVDEAMTRAYARWSSVRAMQNPSGWVYRVAYNWGIDQIRKRRLERSHSKLPEAHHDHFVTEPAVERAVAKLPVTQRAVIVLRNGLDWSERQIADFLGIRPGTVKSRLHRALEALRGELEP